MPLIKSKLSTFLILALIVPAPVSAELASINHSLMHGLGLQSSPEPVSLMGRYRAEFRFADSPVHLLSEIGVEVVNETDSKLLPDISMGVQYSYDVIKYIPHGNVQIGTRGGDQSRASLRVGGGVSRIYQGGWFTFGEIAGRGWLEQTATVDALIFVGVGFTHDLNELY
ncbi:MAG: hypothetical protein ACPGQS_13145 [Bradymonadia bacterium]